MYVAMSKPLFAWDCLEDNPSLATIKNFLESLPDAKLLDGLRRHRGRGRNDCPVHVAWGVVLLRIDLRRFPPIPRATKKFERLYNGRTSVERVNGRFKIFWGVDDGNITGSRRFHAMIGAVMVVHAAFATLLAAAPRREGTLGKLRLSPIQKALRQKPATA